VEFHLWHVRAHPIKAIKVPKSALRALPSRFYTTPWRISLSVSLFFSLTRKRVRLRRILYVSWAWHVLRERLDVLFWKYKKVTTNKTVTIASINPLRENLFSLTQVRRVMAFLGGQRRGANLHMYLRKQSSLWSALQSPNIGSSCELLPHGRPMIWWAIT